MKIKEGFIKRQVGERVVVVPIGEAAKNFHGMINLNETGGELWDLLKENTGAKKHENFSEKIKRGGGFGGIKRKPCSKF